MKIKEVCEKTGLTDRTVRYYIECGLLTPDSKDNYAGRKNYTFTREDVERLEKIKVLRGAGFGVEQIKKLLADRSTREAVTERLQELESDREKNEQLYEALQKADIDREVSVDELVIILSSTPASRTEEPLQEPDRPRTLPYWIVLMIAIIAQIAFWIIRESRFGWMTDGIQWLWFDIAVIIGLFGFYACSHWRRYLAAVCACVLMGSFGVVCGFVNGPALLNETHCAMIDQIPWDDTDYLTQHGFEMGESGILSYTDAALERWNLEKDEAVYYYVRILIQDAYDDVLDPQDYDIHYGGSFINETVYIEYNSMLSELLRIPCRVNRSYIIVSNGKKIYISGNDETAPFDMVCLEDILEELCDGIDS